MKSDEWTTRMEHLLNSVEHLAAESHLVKRRIGALRSLLKQSHELQSRKALSRKLDALFESKLFRQAAWKTGFGNLLKGVGRELRSNAPLRTKRTLHALQNRLKADRVLRSRKAFEREVDAFLQSESHLQAAAQRYIKSIVPPIMADAMATLKKAKGFLVRHSNAKSRVQSDPD